MRAFIDAPPCSRRAHQVPLNRHRVAKQIQDWAMRVDRRRQFPVTSGRFRSAQIDANANRVEAGPYLVVDAEETAQIDIAIDIDIDLVETDAELGCPDSIGDRLARSERSQSILDRISADIGAAKRLGFVN